MRRALWTLGVLLVIGLGTSSTFAARPNAGPQPLSSASLALSQKQNPVEQQSDFPWSPGPLDCSSNANCIVNPTPCAWDVDDHGQLIQVNRTLAAGVTASVSYCVIGDSTQQHVTWNGIEEMWSSSRGKVGVSLRAPSPDLIVSVTYVAQGRTFTLAPIPLDRGFEYRACTQATYDLNDPVLAIIPGSVVNGGNGYGLRTDVVVSVTNPTNKQMRNLSLDVGQVGVGASGHGCLTSSDQTDHLDYPFRWSISE